MSSDHSRSNLGHWSKLLPEELAWVERRCRPGTQPPSVCTLGMLAPGETLQEVCEKDEAILKELGISRGQIADVLELAVESAKDNHTTIPTQGSFTLNGTLYHVELKEYMGKQESPFGGFPKHSHAVVQVINDDTKKTYYFGGGLPEMIRINGFFEGNVQIPPAHHYGRIGVTTFRVDPKKCVKFFGITPESDCTEQLQEARKQKMRYYYSATNILNYSRGNAGCQFST